MKIKDQIRARREQIGMPLAELARKVGVTEQAVRHWESGRSFPGKAKAHVIESALSFSIDWTEGVSHTGEKRGIAAMLEQQDIELLLVICQLPLEAKTVIGQFARLHLAAIEAARKSFDDRRANEAVQPFTERQTVKTSDKIKNPPTPRARKKVG